jgi:hypothetical protein
VYGYYIFSESWYGALNRLAGVYAGEVDHINIGCYFRDGGGKWEAAISLHNLSDDNGHEAPRLEAFGDSWEGLNGIDFLATLAQYNPANKAEVIAMLHELGFVDLTQREQPKEQAVR